MTNDIDAYRELSYDTLAQDRATFVHQHAVDAFTAQHAAPGSKLISVVFALVGLCLHVERGLNGLAVQRVHVALARERRTWPSFAAPDRRGNVTVYDVLAVPPGPERIAAIDRWCESVWQSWRDHHDAVRELIDQLLPTLHWNQDLD